MRLGQTPPGDIGLNRSPAEFARFAFGVAKGSGCHLLLKPTVFVFPGTLDALEGGCVKIHVLTWSGGDPPHVPNERHPVGVW